MKPPEPHRRRLLALLLLATVATHAAAAVRLGDAFPGLREFPLEGTVPADVPGQVLLVDFWASWCAPCKASFPAYAQVHADYAARGVRVIAVSVDEDPRAYQAFLKRYAPPFPVVRDKEQALVRHVDVPAMPTAFLVGRDGRVRAILRGFHGADSDRELRQQLDYLLAESPAP